MNDERILWRRPSGGAIVECAVVSCCAGAELQVRRGDAVVLRELYPMKSDVYERARALEAEYRASGG